MESTTEQGPDAPQPSTPLAEAEQAERDKAARQAWIADIAFVAHEANRAYCDTLNDFSQFPWSEAPEWQRDSAIAGVVSMLTGALPSPEQLHESWSAFKRADGWVYGTIKDATMKTHPCLVPYAELPIEQRRKDVLFRAVVLALATDPDAAAAPSTGDLDALGVGFQVSSHEAGVSISAYLNGRRHFGHGATTAAALADYHRESGK